MMPIYNTAWKFFLWGEVKNLYRVNPLIVILGIVIGSLIGSISHVNHEKQHKQSKDLSEQNYNELMKKKI
jgi:hypothetical protein